MQDTLATTPALPEPPIPQGGQHELDRVTHTRLRRRMMTGRWEVDLRERLRKALPEQRVLAWRIADLSANVFRSAVTQVAVAYNRPPRVSHDDEAAAAAVTVAVRKAGLWSLMQRFQRDTIAAREMLLRVDVTSDGRPTYRPVWPDMVTAVASEEEPDRPVIIREAILRDLGTRSIWTWEVWDISDPEHPSVQVVDERGNDRSRFFLTDAEGARAPEGGLTGELYTWRYADGTPFIPYVLYHASKTGQLWDSYEAGELVEGTLNVALMWSFFCHVVRNASWRQRYGLNVKLATGVTGTGQGRRDYAVTDPATVAMFESDDEAPAGAQSLLSQFDVTSPLELAESIALYERRLAAFAGVSPSDVQRVAGDPRSGYALAISNEGKREAQRIWEPQFRAGDEETLAKTAALMNRAQGSQLSEDGYRLEYESIPLSAEERKAEREHLLELVEAGLLDKVSAYIALHPGLTEADARLQLERIRTINAQYA